jgi:hypothetical protein
MVYRKLTASGDYVMGQNAENLWTNAAQGVAQAITTTLKLFIGTWFLDLTAGIPWITQILGTGTQGLYDQILQSAILGVTGVVSIISYSSYFDHTQRTLTVVTTVQSLYGIVAVSFPIAISSGFGITPFGNNYGDPA